MSQGKARNTHYLITRLQNYMDSKFIEWFTELHEKAVNNDRIQNPEHYRQITF